MDLEIDDLIWIEELGKSYMITDRIPDEQSADIDIYFGEQVEECINFGVQHLKIEKL